MLISQSLQEARGLKALQVRQLPVRERAPWGLFLLWREMAAACETGRCAQPRYMGRSKRAMTQRERALTERLARTR